MKRKKELIILAVIILALVLYLFFRNQNRTQYQLPEIPQISKSDITKIEILKKGSSLVLTRKDNTWRVSPQEYPLDKTKMDSMLDVINDLTLDSLVSESKSYFRYDLDDEKKITVKVWVGDTLSREFDVGKEAPSYQHTYIKLQDDSRVFMARQAFKRRFDQSVDDLRDKAVLSFDKAEIQEMTVTTGGKTLVLSKTEIPLKETDKEQAEETEKDQPQTEPQTETVWKTPSGEKKDTAKVEQILSDFDRLQCAEYINDKSKTDFTDPIYTIQLKGTKDYVLSIFEKMQTDADQHPAVSSENDYPFMLREWKVKEILKKPGELEGENND